MEVGPISAFNGYPVWYKDEKGLRLQLNDNPHDPLSGLTPAELPNPTQPVSFPDNYPEESFYMAAEAEMETGTGERARLVLALEAAFVNDIPRPGEQIVFGRVRIRVAGLRPNETYTVTHPYGVDTFVAEPDGDGAGEINFTEDIGGINGGEFELALNSRVHPFLTWDPAVSPARPEGYIGDPNQLHPIIGSELVDRFGEPQNIFRIEGPGIGIGSPDRSTTPGLNPDNCIETRNFSLLGKISTISGVDVDRTTYTQSETSGGFIDVFASSDVTPQEIVVSGEEINSTTLQGENGLYFARVSYSGETPPSPITVVNISDIPPSTKESTPVDFIQVTANYETSTQTLTIKAFSSDTLHEPSLHIIDFGLGNLPIPASGVLEINLTNVPANIHISSSAGGERVIPVTVDGLNNGPTTVSANAGQDQVVRTGTQVTLNGTKSTGPITQYQWSQLSGTAVNLENANQAIATFTAPEVLGTLMFQLTVEGESGPSTDTVSVEVSELVPAPIANAGPDQVVQQGTLVTLAGSATGNVTSYHWEQISGIPVQINNADSDTASFNFPKGMTQLVFQLTVSGPGGSSTDVIEISAEADSLNVIRAVYRTRKLRWRITGKTDVSGPGVIISIYIGDSLNGTLLGQVEVDSLGDWVFREKPSALVPDESESISLQSSSGGTLINFLINVRR
ncbi:PKD domain-containing protein [Bacillus sp. JJ1562]|uniref:PKD domain-containing protein n=1 Tax=Bacillus sp. JJ1562 TaxID=3122960 RepID=UPI0030029692